MRSKQLILWISTYPLLLLSVVFTLLIACLPACLQQPGSHARRWGMLHRFDSGRLANTKAINEDLTEIQTEELHSCNIDPAAIAWQDRKQGCVGLVGWWVGGRGSRRV